MIVAQLVKIRPRFLWNPKYKSITTELRSKSSPVHILTLDLYKIYFNIILPFTPKFPRWFLSSLYVCRSKITLTIHFYIIVNNIGLEHWKKFSKENVQLTFLQQCVSNVSCPVSSVLLSGCNSHVRCYQRVESGLVYVFVPSSDPWVRNFSLIVAPPPPVSQTGR